MEYLTQALGPVMTRSAKVAWKKLLDTLIVVVKNEVARLDGQ